LEVRPPWAWSPRAKRAVIVLALAGLLFVMIGGLALAGDPSGASTGTANDVTAQTPGNPTAAEMAAELGHVKISLNLFFLIIGGALVFFMQAGFALVETGFCRSKNAVRNRSVLGGGLRVPVRRRGHVCHSGRHAAIEWAGLGSE
jgi:Amt family ammonium transporter